MFTRKIGALAAGVVLATSATIAFATNAVANNEQEENEPTYHSSIQVDPKLDDEAALARLARISIEHAGRIAAAGGGSVTELQLENEHGSLVYAAEVSTGTAVNEVIIDAGDGKILSSVSETEDDDERDDDTD